MTIKKLFFIYCLSLSTFLIAMESPDNSDNHEINESSLETMELPGVLGDKIVFYGVFASDRNGIHHSTHIQIPIEQKLACADTEKLVKETALLAIRKHLEECPEYYKNRQRFKCTIS